MRGNAKGGSTIAFGDYAIQALGRGYFTGNQIEAARVAITRHMKRKGKLWIRVFPHKPITKKPLETRMGKGKADVDYWAAVIKPGTVLFEIAGVPEDLARQAFARICHKMPYRCRMIGRRHTV